MTTGSATAPPRDPGAKKGELAARLGWLGGAVLGLVLLAAAALKALDPVAFAEEIAHQGVAFGVAPSLAALAGLAIEAGLGAALLVNLRRTPLLAAATLLVAFFLFLTGRGAWRAARGIADPAGACGCFGALVDRTPGEALVQDLLLLVPALALAWCGRPGARELPRARAAIAFAFAAAIPGFALAAPRLPLDDWATRLRPGVALAGLCAGRDAQRICLGHVVPELTSGAHLVVLADVRDGGFERLAARLNRYAKSGAEPPLTVLADLTLEERQALFWRIGPAFALHEVPRALLRPLYRTLPRAFRLEDGKVTATWRALPESIPEAPGASSSTGGTAG
jgi:hypothetical protein